MGFKINIEGRDKVCLRAGVACIAIHFNTHQLIANSKSSRDTTIHSGGVHFVRGAPEKCQAGVSLRVWHSIQFISVT